MTQRRHLLLSSLLIAASPLSLAQASEATMPAPPALYIENIPAVPKSVADRLAAYTEFRGHAFSDWHPTKAEMLVGHRAAGASTGQLFRLDVALGELKPVTVGPEPAGAGTYEPKEGRYIVYSRSTGGNEVTQLYRIGLDGGAVHAVHAQRRAQRLWWDGASRRAKSFTPACRLTAPQPAARAANIMTSFWAVEPRSQGPASLSGASSSSWKAAAGAAASVRMANASC